MRLGILGSTRGTHLRPLVNAIKENQLKATIEVVLSNQLDSGILDYAKEQKLHAIHLDAKSLSRDEYDQALTQLFLSHRIDLIVLIGYMRILSASFVNEWKNKIINVHPSLLPDFAGKMDLAVHQAVLDAEKKETGCTVHFVTEELDAGPVLIQKKCQVSKEDTAMTLEKKVQALEASALLQAIHFIQKDIEGTP